MFRRSRKSWNGGRNRWKKGGKSSRKKRQNRRNGSGKKSNENVGLPNGRSCPNAPRKSGRRSSRTSPKNPYGETVAQQRSSLFCRLRSGLAHKTANLSRKTEKWCKKISRFVVRFEKLFYFCMNLSNQFLIKLNK